MVVVSLTACSVTLRGELTKWLQEVTPCVYVGRVSKRVRDELWKLVCEKTKSGRATMVFPAHNEQGYDFLVHNSHWTPIDCEGLRLILRPADSVSYQPKATRFSYAAHRSAARRAKAKRHALRTGTPASYAVIDLETTGLDPERDTIIEIGALKVIKGKPVDEFSSLVRTNRMPLADITQLTGITDAMLRDQGKALEEALDAFLTFVDALPLVAHNGSFDMAFLQRACDSLDFGDIDNQLFDTLEIARRILPNLTDYRLKTLGQHLGIVQQASHRALSDCRVTHALYEKLVKLDPG